ncbi:MAG: VWA domain-containing protein [Vicinamibacteria bacterium]|nr:VWA domain-containing protein [Vicinamibacteria bacterium]
MSLRLASLGLALYAVASSPTAAPVVLVLDASGSMWGQVSGEAKIVGARRVVGQVAERLSDGTSFGLVAYGHRREGDCADIETVLSPAPLDRASLGRAVAALTPKGKTPITAALEQAFTVAPRGATIVLVTDGLETCGGDPCAAARAAKGRGLDFVLHVIGLDVEKEDVVQLECSAQAGGGLYRPAKDAAALAAALQSALEAPVAAADGVLVVKALRKGELQDVALRVTPSAGGPELTARTYKSAETNPRTLPLATGRYRVQASALGIRGADEREFEVDIAKGARVERTLDYSTGRVSIGATRNGQRSDVTWQLFRPGDRKKAVATGRTYRDAKSNPAQAEVPAGEYDVVLTALEIGGSPSLEAGRLNVEPGGRAEIAKDFPSAALAIGVVRGAASVDAVVTVRSRGKGIDQGRTYKTAGSGPKRFTLAPGTYEIDVREIKGATRTLTVTLAAGADETHTVDLDQP